MDFSTTFFNTAIKAAGQFLRQRNGYTSFDYDLFSAVAKPIMEGSIDALVTEWDKLIDANVSDETRRQYVNAQAIELGDKIADAYHTEKVWSLQSTNQTPRAAAKLPTGDRMKSLRTGSKVKYNEKEFTVVDVEVDFFWGEAEITLILDCGDCMKYKMSTERFYRGMESGKAEILSK